MRCELQNMTLQVCSVRGIGLKIHALLPVVTIMAIAAAGAAGAGGLGMLLAFIVSGPLLFLTVLIHELGHVFAARRCGLPVDHILLWPMGGLAVIGGPASGPKDQIFISAAGPATHVPMILFWLILLLIFNGFRFAYKGFFLDRDFMAVLSARMFFDNIVMMLFNLFVPCFPLDCSQILLSCLLLRGTDPSRSAQIIVWCSCPVIAFLVGMALWSYFEGQLAATMTLFMGLWLGSQTFALHRARRNGELNSHPLFVNAPKPGAAQQAANVSIGRSSFSAFTGSANVLGGGNKDAAPVSQVCAGALFSVMATVLTVMYTTPTSELPEL